MEQIKIGINIHAFIIKFINLSRSLGNNSPGLSMQEFRDFYSIFAVDVSAQATVSKTNQLTLSVERREVPAQNAETPKNPRDNEEFLKSYQKLKYK